MMNLKRLVLTAALLALIGGGAFAAELPISRVVLFSSGVGYFEREGVVEGDATVELQFRTEQIRDILKSLVLQDLDGGTIAPVTYAPLDPLARTLSSFSVDISDNPDVAELWDRLRGAKVEISAETTYKGIVFGAEEQEKSVGDNVMTYSVLNLLTEKGFVSVPLWQVQAIEVLDAGLEKELRSALAAIDKARDADKRPVTLSFKGEGERAVSVGYLLETPVWKTSYRLVADDEEGMYLQGWAVVENTSDDDWRDVGLSLVSGRPVSFIQDLYEPLYVARPVIPVSVSAAAAPRVWEGAMDGDGAEEAPGTEATILALSNGKPRSKRMAGAGMPGAGMGMGMGMGMAAPSPAPDPAMRLRETSAASMAAGGKVGTLFQYAINQPVTIPRQRSAMIPIIGDKIEGAKLSVYNQSADAKHPMNGIKLKNTSELHLMGGPITVFDGGVYGGDALIADVAPGQERLITYAMDLAVEVDPKSKAHPQEIMSVRIVRGVMVIKRKSRMEVTYNVKNSADEKRLVLIEHPLKGDWTLIQPKQADETTRSAYRFEMKLEPGKSGKLTVVEDHPRDEIVRLAGRNPDQVALLLKTPKLSDAMKAALQKVIQMQGELAAVTRERTEKETRIKEIEQEQDRIRKNMGELDRQSQLYRQYVEKFTKQETEFETLRGEVKQLKQQEADRKKAVQDYIAGLNVG